MRLVQKSANVAENGETTATVGEFQAIVYSRALGYFLYFLYSSMQRYGHLTYSKVRGLSVVGRLSIYILALMSYIPLHCVRNVTREE